MWWIDDEWSEKKFDEKMKKWNDVVLSTDIGFPNNIFKKLLFLFQLVSKRNSLPSNLSVSSVYTERRK